MNDAVGELEYLVLLTILRIGPAAYGVPIVEELRRNTRRAVLRPSVYLALRRLEEKGLVRSRLGEPEARRGGRARRFFELSAAGKRHVRESQRVMQRLLRGVSLDEA
jgi:DNA-binding PadR family transcriptional regulator